MSKIHASWAEWSHLVCTDELKMNILAKSCLCPVRMCFIFGARVLLRYSNAQRLQGFSTLVANLITSSSDYDVGNLGSLDKEWVEEYLDGYGQEVCSVQGSDQCLFRPFHHSLECAGVSRGAVQSVCWKAILCGRKYML